MLLCMHQQFCHHYRRYRCCQHERQDPTAVDTVGWLTVADARAGSDAR